MRGLRGGAAGWFPRECGNEGMGGGGNWERHGLGRQTLPEAVSHSLIPSPHSRTSRIRPDHLDVGAAVAGVTNVHQPGAAADLAVLDVFLVDAAPRIEGDLVRLAAVGALDERLRLRIAVAEGELVVDAVLRPLLLVRKIDHLRKVACGYERGRPVGSLLIRLLAAGDRHARGKGQGRTGQAFQPRVWPGPE